MLVSSNEIKDLLNVVSKLKLQDFAVKKGIFAKDLFGTYVIVKMKQDINFHCLSEKHAKMIALLSSNCDEVNIDNTDDYCIYTFYDNKNVIGTVSIPEGAFESSNVSLVSKIEEVNNSKKSVFQLPVKISSKLIEIVNDVNVLNICKQDNKYILKIVYNDNISEIVIKEDYIKSFDQEVNLPVHPFYLLVSSHDTAELTLSEDYFMLKSNMQSLEMYVICSYSADSKEIIALTENIELKDLL